MINGLDEKKNGWVGMCMDGWKVQQFVPEEGGYSCPVVKSSLESAKADVPSLNPQEAQVQWQIQAFPRTQSRLSLQLSRSHS